MRTKKSLRLWLQPPPDGSLPDHLTKEELISTFDDLKPLVRERRGNDLKFLYAVGTIVAKRYAEVQEKRAREGMKAKKGDFCDRLEYALDVRDGLFADCWKLVETFDPATFQRLSEAEHVTPGHVLQLMVIQNQAARDKMIERVLAERMDLGDLIVAIREQITFRPSRRTRPLNAKDVTGALSHIMGTTTKYLSLVERTWFGANFDLAKEARTTRLSQIDLKLCQQVTAAADALEKMAHAALAGAAQLRDAEKCMQERMIKRDDSA